MRPALLSTGEPQGFPNPELFDDEGLVAVGGDLSEERLLHAYRAGVFPWYNAGYPPLWWSPNPRSILPLDAMHISRSMRRRLRKRDFKVTWNQDFGQVIRACGAGRHEGTWILPEMISAYERLHTLGHAYSIEVWSGANKLVGGLYGVQCGGLFAAESMFHRASDMSKVALLYAGSSLRNAGIRLFDVQFLTSHLASLGAREVSRAYYLQVLRQQRTRPIDLQRLALTPPVDS